MAEFSYETQEQLRRSLLQHISVHHKSYATLRAIVLRPLGLLYDPTGSALSCN